MPKHKCMTVSLTSKKTHRQIFHFLCLQSSLGDFQFFSDSSTIDTHRSHSCLMKSTLLIIVLYIGRQRFWRRRFGGGLISVVSTFRRNLALFQHFLLHYVLCTSHYCFVRKVDAARRRLRCLQRRRDRCNSKPRPPLQPNRIRRTLDIATISAPMIWINMASLNKYMPWEKSIRQ